MRFTYGFAGHIAVLIGIILALFGMFSNTGLVNWGFPTCVMYIGYVLLIGGLVVLYVLDRQERTEYVPDQDSEEPAEEPSLTTEETDVVSEETGEKVLVTEDIPEPDEKKEE